MWRSGAARRRQDTALAEMVETATRSGRYAEPWRSDPRVWEFFPDDGAVLRELQRQWRTTLAGAVYVAIDAGDGDLHSDVVAAYTKVHRRHLGLRRILEAHADHPAIASAMRKEQALLGSFLTPSADLLAA